MKLSKRLIDLLDWWVLRIQKTNEKGNNNNVTRHDIDDACPDGNSMGNKD